MPTVLNDIISCSDSIEVLRQLPLGKSPGIDGLQYEAYINSSDIMVEYLCKLFNVILRNGVYPDSWAMAMISPIHKKGDKSDVNNYRGISLLCTVSKIFTKILNIKMTTWVDINCKLDESQAAYRKGYSTIDHIFSLYCIAQKFTCRKGGRFYCAFVDFSKAFDSIPHSKLWYTLIKEGVHGNFLKVLMSMYSKLKSCIKTPLGITEHFQCILGTRQGCMISPLLFIIYLMELNKMLLNSNCPGIFLDNNYPDVHLLMYADDICIMADTVGRLQQQLNVLELFCKRYGMRVNLTKTNVIVFRNGGPLRKNEKFYYNNQQIETATYYKYLGTLFSSSLKWPACLNNLSQQASKAQMFHISSLFKTYGDTPISASFNIFDKCIVPILLYGSEIWGYQYREQIEKIQIDFCKRLLGVSSQTPNLAVLGDCGRKPLSVIYMTRCIKFWLKLVQNFESHRLPKRCYNMIYSLSTNNKTPCATYIKYLLCKAGFGHVWIQQGVGNSNLFLTQFKQRLCDISVQDWSNDVHSISKLDAYCLYKTTPEMEKYILIIKYRNHRTALSRLRCTNHRLAIEKLRGQTTRNLRYCKYCLTLGNTHVEDEYHFVLKCPLYDNLRCVHILPYIRNVHLNSFISLMTTQNETTIHHLAQYAYEAFNMHRHFSNV